MYFLKVNYGWFFIIVLYFVLHLYFLQLEINF